MGGEYKKEVRDKKNILVIAGVALIFFALTFMISPMMFPAPAPADSGDSEAVSQLTDVIQQLQAKVDALESGAMDGIEAITHVNMRPDHHVESFVANEDRHEEVMELELHAEGEGEDDEEPEHQHLETKALSGLSSSYSVSDVKSGKNVQSGGKHSWTNPNTKNTYMKMYNEYHRLRSGANSCHGCRYLPAVYKVYPKIKSVFDAGCGTGNLVRGLLKANKEAYGVEAASLPLEAYASDLLQNKTVFIRPLHDTPFKNDYFDFIISTEVFEHVPLADVDRSVKELIRIAKPNAKMFFTIGMGTSRFDTKDGRKKSEVAEFALDFKFHETVQSRRWWLDTFCGLGLFEDVQAYKSMVSMMAKNGYPQNIPPRGWFALQKGKIGSRPCKCTVAAGRKADIWCGPGRKTKVET